MKLSHNSVLAFEALNPLAQLVETPAEMAMLHPAYAVKEIEKRPLIAFEELRRGRGVPIFSKSLNQ